MDQTTKLDAPSGVGVYALVRWLAPVCRVHHLSYSFGWVLHPVLPWTIGCFEFGRSHDKHGNWSPKWALRLVKKKDFHNCTWTGGIIMAKTVAEAKANGDAYFEAWNSGYWIGFEDGGNDTLADFDALLDSLDLPFDIDEMQPMDVIREMAKRLSDA